MKGKTPQKKRGDPKKYTNLFFYEQQKPQEVEMLRCCRQYMKQHRDITCMENLTAKVFDDGGKKSGDIRRCRQHTTRQTPFSSAAIPRRKGPSPIQNSSVLLYFLTYAASFNTIFSTGVILPSVEGIEEEKGRKTIARRGREIKHVKRDAPQSKHNTRTTHTSSPRGGRVVAYGASFIHSRR